MTIKEFLKYYPKKKPTDNKFNHGNILLISGSKGMAGAAILNIIGARSLGASYIHSLIEEDIYPIVASNQITTVYHLDNSSLKSILPKIEAIGFGSGLTNNPHKEKLLKEILKSNLPLVIDAEGLQLLSKMKFPKIKSPTILTPHLGEFSKLTSLPISEIEKNKKQIAINYATQNNIILVLKGPNTLVVSNKGELYINNSGNESLATAGSGDVLTGMITTMCSLQEDPYIATKCAVWFHGYLADQIIKSHSKVISHLEDYPKYADEFFKKYNY